MFSAFAIYALSAAFALPLALLMLYRTGRKLGALNGRIGREKIAAAQKELDDALVSNRESDLRGKTLRVEHENVKAELADAKDKLAKARAEAQAAADTAFVKDEQTRLDELHEGQVAAQMVLTRLKDEITAAQKIRAELPDLDELKKEVRTAEARIKELAPKREAVEEAQVKLNEIKAKTSAAEDKLDLVNREIKEATRRLDAMPSGKDLNEIK